MKPSPNPNDRNCAIHYHLKSLNAYPRLKVTPIREQSKNPATGTFVKATVMRINAWVERMKWSE